MDECTVDKKNDWRNLHLSFVGKIIAGFTHEMKNYLAIINESVGLIGDMIKIGKSPKNNVPEYLDIIHSIEDQIEKANDHFRYLNRFAHRMDTPLSSFNINESMEELTALMKRFANQKRISFGKDFQNNMPPVYSNPSLIQLIVFSFLEKYTNDLEKNSKITIQTSVSNNSVQIRIITEGNFAEGDTTVWIPGEILDNIMKQLGGRILQERRNETVLMLPLTFS